MRLNQRTGIFLLLTSLLLGVPPLAAKWGFFGHRRINRLAVFTLPPAMAVFYKKHIEYITEHAVDPDKRRYASKHEAIRHYIDLDRHGKFPFPSLPRRWDEALAAFTELYVATPQGDTLLLFGRDHVRQEGTQWMPVDTAYAAFRYWPAEGIPVKAHQLWFNRNILPQYYEDVWQISCDSLRAVFGAQVPCTTVLAADSLSPHGILPYHLAHMQLRLTEAFRTGNVQAILRLSSEMGHYIGDAHVPLHTTMNYNGQLTGQTGIHAFWESRIPELFADARYDFFVGQAQYIKDPPAFFWEVVLESHRLVDSVLLLEKELSATFPRDKQFCYEERGSATIRTQCSAYAEAYQARLNGMVERRMRASVRVIGSSWYTAWVDAGQPDLLRLKGSAVDEATAQMLQELDAALRRGQALGRPHE